MERAERHLDYECLKGSRFREKGLGYVGSRNSGVHVASVSFR